MKLIKYSIALTGLFFISAIIPGIVCVLLGFNGIWTSSGISLAIVCLLKGKIAKKILGANTTHHSSPNVAFFLIAISLISGGIKAYTFYVNKTTMESLGFTYESTREQVFSQLFIPLLIASLFWAIVVGLVTYIRGKQKRHKTQEIVDQPKDLTSIVSQTIENAKEIGEDSEPKTIPKEESSSIIRPINTVKISDKSKIQKIYNKWILTTLRNYKKYVLGTLVIIIVVALFLFVISKITVSSNTVCKYLYADSQGNIHVDKNCSAISSIGVNRIEFEDISDEDLQACCHICVDDNIYEKLRDIYKNRIIEQRLSNIYDVLRIYKISNIPSNKLDFRTWIETNQENLEYIHNILSLMRVREIGNDMTTFKSWLNSDDKSNVDISTAIMRLHETCEREGLNVGDFNEFLRYMQYSESDRQWVFSKLIELNYDMEPYQEYYDTMTALVPYESSN